MSDTAKLLFENLKGGVKEAVSQIGATLAQKGVQGSAELASALFTGNGYVPYGPGQNPPQQEQSRGMGR